MMPYLKNKQNRNTNQIISKEDYHLTQPYPSEEKQTNKQTRKLSTNLILYEAYTNHWINLRRTETKRKKDFNLEAWEKENSNTINYKIIIKRQRNTIQLEEQTRNTEVQINEQEIGKLPEK